MEDDELRRLFAEMRQDFDALRRENAAQHAETRRYTDGKVGAAVEHLSGKIEDLSRETAIRFNETAINFREIDIRFEDVERRFDTLAESFLSLHERLDREAADIRLEMRQGFADTHALIKFGYGELDRRVTALEQK